MDPGNLSYQRRQRYHRRRYHPYCHHYQYHPSTTQSHHFYQNLAHPPQSSPPPDIHNQSPLPIPSAMDGNWSYLYPQLPYPYVYTTPYPAELPQSFDPHCYTTPYHQYQPPQLNPHSYIPEASFSPNQDTIEAACLRIEAYMEAYNEQVQALSDRWNTLVPDNTLLTSSTPSPTNVQVITINRSITVDAHKVFDEIHQSPQPVTTKSTTQNPSRHRMFSVLHSPPSLLVKSSAWFRAKLRLWQSKRPLQVDGCRRSRRLRKWRFSVPMTLFAINSSRRSETPPSIHAGLINNGKPTAQITAAKHRSDSPPSFDADLVNIGESVIFAPLIEDKDEVSSNDKNTSGLSEASDEPDRNDASYDVLWPPWTEYKEEDLDEIKDQWKLRIDVRHRHYGIRVNALVSSQKLQHLPRNGSRRRSRRRHFVASSKSPKAQLMAVFVVGDENRGDAKKVTDLLSADGGGTKRHHLLQFSPNIDRKSSNSMEASQELEARGSNFSCTSLVEECSPQEHQMIGLLLLGFGLL